MRCLTIGPRLQILSVPVVDEKSGQPHAFIDAIDIVTHVADILLEVCDQPSSVP